MSSRDGERAATCWPRGALLGCMAGEGGSAASFTCAGSCNCTSLAVSWLDSACAAVDGLGSRLAIDALALIMTSRVASEVNHANSTATHAAADAVIRSLSESDARLRS